MTRNHAKSETQITLETSGGAFVQARVMALLDEATASITLDNGTSLHARQAASCLLAPAIGDRVLVHHDNGEDYILAVLKRSSQYGAEISVPGAEQVTIKSAEKLELIAPVMAVRTKRFEVFARAIFQSGETLTKHFKRVLETVVDKTVNARSINTKAETRTAVVTEVEMLNANTLVQNIEQVATQNSEITLVTARRDVRLDAERISVG